MDMIGCIKCGYEEKNLIQIMSEKLRCFLILRFRVWKLFVHVEECSRSSQSATAAAAVNNSFMTYYQIYYMKWIKDHSTYTSIAS